MSERIALVVSALTGDELSGGRRDSTKVYNALTDPSLGACSLKSPPPFCDCADLAAFNSNFQSVIRALNQEDQLIFYFSGHGNVISGEFVIQVGASEDELLPFENLVRDFRIRSLKKGIFILDACHSGAAFGEKGPSPPIHCISQIPLPRGLAILASSREFEKSFEKEDGSGSVFTHILCQAIETGLGGLPTPGAVITIDQIVEYINSQLCEPEFAKYMQTCQYKVFGSEGAMWIAHNKTGKEDSKRYISVAATGIKSEIELKLAYESTVKSKHPCYGAKLEDLDWQIVRDFAQEELGDKAKHLPNELLARSLQLFSPLVTSPTPHNAAVLCFCQNPSKFLPQAEVVFTVGNPADPRFIRNEIRGPLAQQIDKTLELVMTHLDLVTIIGEGSKRREEPEIPKAIVREIISNAICHRDYINSGTVQIRLNNNFLDIQSPGTFPANMTWEDLISRNIGSKPVDAVITYYLVRLRTVERIGRGFELIRNYIRTYGKDSIYFQLLAGPSVLLGIRRRRSQRDHLTVLKQDNNIRSNINNFQILHLSDLHINEKFFDQSMLDLLILRIEKDQKEGVKPEIVVVSGDIAFKGVKKEYDLAKKFFDELLTSLNLGNDRIFIVPGNHDVNRKLYRRNDVPAYKNMTELNVELENSYYRSDLLKGMSDYFSFIEKNYPHLKSQNEKLVPFIAPYTTACGKTIGIIGLNSAWMCRKSPDREKVAIGEYQIKKAVEALGKGKALDLQIFMFHHPLAWLWPKDKNICRTYFNNVILLCGHLHEPGGGYMEDLDGRLHQFQAGGAYLGSNSDWPCSFHYITFDWRKDLIKLDFRRFNPEKRKWILDAETGDEGEKLFPMRTIVTGDSQEKKKPQGTHQKKPGEYTIFKPYLNSALEEYRHLPTQGFETKVRISIELEQIYVNMRAVIQSCDFTYTLEGKKLLREKIQEENLSTLDIKATFTAARKYNIKDMVILGDPGSGKTTLLKYILIMLIQGRGEEKIGIDTGLIPFFAPLRELKDPDKEGFIDFIKRVCRLNKFAIQEKDLLSVLDSGSGLVLLDGLDEVADEKTRIRTCQWIDEARIRFAKARFIITSRFAGYLGKSRLEGNCLELSIQDFTKDEIKTFLIRWFESVEAIVHAGEDDTFWRQKGHEEALTLFQRITESEHIRKLAATPLLLQIIALVHRDRGRLPQRRVELYEECTNVLLEKWDMAKGLNSLISAREARQVLQPLALWLHTQEGRRSAPLEQIVKVIEGPLQEIGKSYLDRKRLLLNIRDRSGIFMGYSESEYGFIHRSFQEYLTAEYIRNKGEINLLIEKYGQKWWKEVTRLCLELNNPSVIEDFMYQIIRTEHFKTDISLIMDAIGDSIVKPTKPFIDALNDRNLSIETKLNSIVVLKNMGGPKAAKVLKTIVLNKNNPPALIKVAHDALKSIGATKLN